MSNAIPDSNEFTWSEVEAAFQREGNPIKNKAARCPCHDDRNPSLSVDVDDGRLLVHCQAGCEQNAVFKACLDIVQPDQRRSSSLPPLKKASPPSPTDNSNIERLKAEYEKFSEVGSELPDYCKRKGIKHHGAKQDGSSLVVPMYSEGGLGELIGYQEIKASGEKRTATGSKKAGSGFIIGDHKPGDTILVCEGFATAASVYECSGVAVVCTFGADNLLKVAETLKSAGYSPVVSPDNDNAGERARKQAKERYRVALPQFNGPHDPKENDWNDLAKRSGAEEVKRQIEEALESKEPEEKGVVPRGKGKKKASYQETIEFLKATFPDKEPRKDLISGKLKVWHRGRWLTVTGRGGEAALILESDARHSGGFYDHVGMWSDFGKYESSLDGELLLDIPEWDRRARINDFADALNAECFSREQVRELLKDWLVGAYRKAHDPRTQNRVLILQGAQGIGKDQFISALISPFSGEAWAPDRPTVGGYVANMVMKPNMGEDDWGRFLCSYLVVNVSEFDRVKGGGESFKAMVTASNASWAPKYVEEVQTRPMRASIVASINPKDINKDPSGARRYLPIELAGPPKNRCEEGEAPAIRWEAYDEAAKEPGQVLAEIVELSKTWEGLSEHTRKALEGVQARLTPQDDVQAAMEDVIREVQFGQAAATERHGREFTITKGGKEVTCFFISRKVLDPILERAAEDAGVPTKAVKSRLHQTYDQYRKKDKRGFLIPVPPGWISPVSPATPRVEEKSPPDGEAETMNLFSSQGIEDEEFEYKDEEWCP